MEPQKANILYVYYITETDEDDSRLPKMSEDYKQIRKFSTSFLSLYSHGIGIVLQFTNSTSFLSLYSHGKEIFFAVYKFEFFKGDKAL